MFTPEEVGNAAESADRTNSTNLFDLLLQQWHLITGYKVKPQYWVSENININLLWHSCLDIEALFFYYIIVEIQKT